MEWFHQKDYPPHAKVGASGSTKCQQFIGGAIPPEWRCTYRREDAYWQCWSPAQLTCILRIFKPIAAGRIVPPERLPTACKGGGLRKHKMPAVHWWSYSTRIWRCMHLKRGGYMLAVLISSSANVLRLEAYCGWWNGSTRKTTHCTQRWL